MYNTVKSKRALFPSHRSHLKQITNISLFCSNYSFKEKSFSMMGSFVISVSLNEFCVQKTWQMYSRHQMFDYNRCCLTCSQHLHHNQKFLSAVKLIIFWMIASVVKFFSVGSSKSILSPRLFLFNSVVFPKVMPD